MALQSLQTLKDMGPQIQWLHSYVTEDKVYCVYLAPDEDCIREHARRVGIPADRVAAAASVSARAAWPPARARHAAPSSARDVPRRCPSFEKISRASRNAACARQACLLVLALCRPAG